MEKKASTPKPKKTWKNMPLWKKILVIWFLIVCGFGVYDTLFPSENSLTIEDLLPVVVTATGVPPSPSLSPLLTPTIQLSPTN